MILEIISTGEEVLSGQIVDTNASWLSAELANMGIAVSRRLTVGDRMDDLVASFRERSLVADVVLVTGGLGPTSDDLSSKAMAQAAGVSLRLFKEWWEALQHRYAQHNRTLDPQNIQQATLPETATLMDNPVGTACGFKVPLNKSLFYFMPGVPSEMKKMFRDIVMPELNTRYSGNIKHELHVFQTFGWAESVLGRMLSAISLPSTIKLGYRTRIPTVEIKMMCSGANDDDKRGVAQQIRQIIGDRLYSESNQTLAAKVHELMMERKSSLTAAESCTGGLLSSLIVDNPGSSAYFNRGYICYSYESKTDLGVPATLLQEYGAVSVQVAKAMAQRAQTLANTQCALAITGIAGPDGGTPEKPVGTVAFALAVGETMYAQMLRLPPWGRQRIREISAFVALDMLRRHLLGLDVYATSDLIRRVDARP